MGKYKKPLVKISNLSKIFEIQNIYALKSINVEFYPGKIIGLVGPDGAGKTTLIRIMAGLLKPTHGNVEILGNDTIQQSKNIYQLISYMPQKFGLYEDLTVLQNLNLYADLQNISKKSREDIFEKLLHFTNLKSFTKRLAKNLSGGMKQKLGLACTLLRKPQFLLLDEPSVGVDPISRRELWKMVLALSKENISILWSTAYLDEAEKCQEVLLLNKGGLLYFGPPEILTNKMKERVFQIQNISENRRSVLSKALKDEATIDGIIQGNSVRIVLKPTLKTLDISKFNPGKDAILKTISPRFEDAFIDILGGGPKKASPLLKLIPPIKKEKEIVLEVIGLKKCFGDFTAVDQINFSVKRGEIFGLLGPNGAGKSTTFKMLCGLLKPTQGDAYIVGLSIKKVTSQARARIGYMAQKFSLYENMTVVQNMNFFSGIYPIPNIKRKNIVNKLITIFDLSKFINTKASKLPLGFKQRLALSCAIMHNPEVLFLDEPTSGVDPITRREFWNHINGMVEKGISVIITTHFMDEAEYCDRIGLINKGQLIIIGTPDELKNSVASKDLPSPTLEDAFIIFSKKEKKDVTKI
ncbi:MAG: multidrug ABC transporter ATP-binding protein [Chlamydiae bacterium SM23_39]|nr:MAG: multidrug ABC transporter ATP-binding protein [Chlamydiae bacterium SM23_39]